MSNALDKLSLNPEENALLEYLLETKEITFVILTEDYHPVSQSVNDTMQSIQKENPGIELIEGRYSTYQRFAQTQDAFGFPTTMIFYQGELQDLFLGKLDQKIVQKKLDEMTS